MVFAQKVNTLSRQFAPTTKELGSGTGKSAVNRIREDPDSE